MRKFAFVAFALIVVVKANFFAAAVRGIEPMILSVGTVLAAFGLNVKLKDDLPLFISDDPEITVEEEIKKRKETAIKDL